MTAAAHAMLGATLSTARPALGVILPASNRNVERATGGILAGHPQVDVCFTRVPYGGHPPDGYDLAPFRQAATLLAEARPGVILWNATRGALLGFAPDRALCAMIERETGIRATTTALATIALLRARGLRRIGLLAQGDAAETARLVERFDREGIAVVTRLACGIADNFDGARIALAALEAGAERLLATSDAEAVLIWSTNLPGHASAPALSARLGRPVLDATAIGTQQALSWLLAGGDMTAA